MFVLSKEHEDFRAVVREFAEAEVSPHIAQWDRDSHFPADLVPKMGDLGLFGLVVPEEYGGADQSIGITLSAGVGLGINPILSFGSEEQKARFLPDLVAGRALAAF